MYVLDSTSNVRYLLGPITGDLYVNDELTYLWDTNTDWLGARFYDPATQEFLSTDELFWLNYNGLLENASEVYGDLGSLEDVLGEELEELQVDTRLDGLFEDDDDDIEPAPVAPGVPTITQPEDYFNIAFKTDPTLSGTATNADTVLVTFTYLDVNGDEVVETHEATVAGDSWSLTLDPVETSLLNSDVVEDGTEVTVDVAATNEVGTTSAQEVFVADYTAPPAPTVENEDELGNEGWLTDSTPELQGSAEPNSIVLLTLSDGEGGESATYATTADSSGDWRIDTGDESYLLDGEITLDEGEVATINVTSEDAAGNVSDPADGFPREGEVDTIGVDPATITNPTDGSAFSRTDFDITGESEPGSIVLVTVSDPDGNGSEHTLTADSSGVWVLEAEDWDGDDFLDEDELMTVTAIASDPAGNESTAVTSAATYAQGEDIVTPEDDALINDLTPVIAGVGLNPGDELYVRLSDDSGESATYAVTVDAQGGWTINLDSGGDVPVDGSSTITFEESETMEIQLAHDADFFPVLKTHDNITFDVTPPAPPTIEDPADSGAVTDTTPTLTGSAEAGATILVTMDDGIDKATYSLDADENGDWVLDPDVLEPIAADEGFGFETGSTASVTATATDAAGNVSEVTSLSFDIIEIIDGTPVISVPDDGGLVNSETPEIHGVADEGATVLVTLSDDNGEVAIYEVTADDDGNWSLDLATATPVDSTDSFSIDHEENITVEASATGESGETNYADPVTFSVDTEAPSRPSIETPDDNGFAQDEPILDGTAEPLSTVTVVLGDDSGFETYITTADANGDWQVDLETTEPTGGDIELMHGEEISMSVTATDAAGNESPADSLVFTVDIIAPDEPVIISPTPGGGVTDDTPVIIGSAEAGSTISVTLTDDDSTEIYTAIPVESDGSWTLDLENETALTGDVEITASATDQAGNQSEEASSSFSILTINDGVPQITTPEDGSFVNDETPVISGAADPGDTVYVTITDNDSENGPFSAVYQTTADSQGNWQIDLDVDQPIEGSIVLDENEVITVTASAEDSSGSKSDDSPPTSFTIDTIPPNAVNIDSPGDESTIVDPEAVITGTADPETEIRVTLVEIASDEQMIYTVTSDAEGNWTVDLAEDNAPDFGLDDGEAFEIYAEAYDQAGNVSEPTNHSFSVSLLDEEGTPEIHVPANGDFSDDTPLISGSAVPGAVVTVTLTDETDNASQDYIVTADANGAWSLDIANETGNALGFDDGDIFSVTATADGHHNTENLTATPSPLEFTIDAIAPDAPVIEAPVDEADLTVPPDEISGTAEPNSTVQVVLTDENDDSVTYLTEANSLGAWKIDLTSDQPEADPDSGNPMDPLVFDLEGSFNIEANAIDIAGNVSEAATSSFDIDQVAPDAPVIESPADGSFTLEEFTVRGTSDEEGGEVKLTVTDDAGNSQIYSGTVVNGEWEIAVDDKIANTGEEVTLTATVTDAAGNTSDPSATNTISLPDVSDLPAILDPETGGSIGENSVISGLADDDIDRVRLVFEDEVGNTWTYYADVNNDDGSSYWEVDLANLDPADVEGTADFTHDESITITAYDDANDDSSPGSSVEVTVDTVAPDAPEITAPAVGAAINGTDLPDIEGTAEADSVVELVLTDTVEGVSSTFYVTADGDGNWILDGSSADLDFTLDDEDDLTITATAIDAANNRSDEASQPLSIRLIENGAPELSYPADGDVLNGSELFPTLQGVSEPNATVFVTINDGEDDDAIYSVTANDTGQWELDLSAANPDSGSFNGFDNNDDVSVTLSADNGDGVIVDGVQDYRFSVDTSAPDAPEIVTPEGDYYSDEAGVSGTSEPESVLLVTLSDGQESATYSVTADGNGDWSLDTTADLQEGSVTLDDGEILTVSATASDEAGNSSERTTETFTIDLFAPSDPTLTSPSGTVGISEPVLEGTADEGSTVVVVLNDQDGEGPVTYEVVAEAGDVWTLDLADQSGFNFVDDGDIISVDLYAYDEAGNTSNTVNESYTYDGGPLSITYPADGSFVGDEDGDGIVPTYIEGVADAGETVTLVVTDETYTATYQVVADSTRNWVLDTSDPGSFTPLGGGVAFDDGETVTVTATTASASDTATFTIDMTPPAAPEITDPAQDEWVPDLTPIISGSSEADGFVRLAFTDVDDNETVVVTAEVDSSGNWTFNTESDSGLTGLFEDGDQVAVTATAIDQAGNESSGTDTVSFIVTDFNAGYPTIVEPVGDFDNTLTPELSGLADPNTEVTLVISDNDGDEATYVVTSDSSGVWVLDFADDPDLYLTGGSISIDEADEITAIAAVQNQTGGFNESAPKVFTVDTTAPADPEITEPSTSPSIEQDPVLGTGEDGSIIRLVVSEGSEQAIFTTEVVNGNWAIDIWLETPASGDSSFLEDGGLIDFEARAYDEAGNESGPDRVTVEYDLGVPEQPTIDTPSDGDVIPTDVPELSGTAVGADYVLVILDDSEDGKSTYKVEVTNDTWSLDLETDPRTEDGDKFTVDDKDSATVEVIAFDDSGNESEPSTPVTFTYDSILSGPGQIISPEAGTAVDPDRDELVIEGTGPAGGTITLEIYDGYSTLGVDTVDITVDGSGLWSYTVDDTQLVNTDFRDGTDASFTIIDAKDEDGGDVQYEPYPVSLVIDTEAPVAPTISVPAGQYVNDETPEVSGSAEANSTVLVTIISDDGTGSTYQTTADGAGTWTLDLDDSATYQEIAGDLDMDNGDELTITATASDALGHTSDASTPVETTIYLFSANQPEIIDPDGGDIGNNTTINGFAPGAEDEVYLTLTDSKINESMTVTLTADSTGAWFYELDASTFDPGGDGADLVHGGGLLLEVSSSPDKGTTVVDGNPVTVTMDLEGPLAPTILTPTTDDYITEDPWSITGSAEENSIVMVTLSDSDDETIYRVTTDGSGSWNIDVGTDTPENTELTLTDGDDLTITAIAYDPYDNRSPVASQTNSVDILAPDAPVLTSPGDSQVIGVLEPLLEGTSEPNAIVYVTLADQENDSAVKTVTADASGNWVLDLAQDTINFADDEDFFTVTMMAEDATGKTSPLSDPVTFQVTEDQDPTITTPEDGADVRIDALIEGVGEPSSTVYVTVNDGNGVGTYQVATDQNGYWSLDFGLNPTPIAGGTVRLDDGENVSIAVSDVSGGTATDSVNVTVDGVPPDKPVITEPAAGFDDITPVIAGTAGGNPDYIVLTIEDLTGGMTETVTTTVDSSGNWEINMESITFASGFQFNANDNIEVEAQSYDAAGNESPISDTFSFRVIDPSEPSILSPTDQSYENDTTPTIVGYVTSPGAEVLVTVADNNGEAAIYSVFADSDGIWQVTVGSQNDATQQNTIVDTPIASTPTFDLDDGEIITINAGSYDTSGILNYAETVTVTLDTTPPPELTVTAPLGVTGDNTPLIEGDNAEAGATIYVTLHDDDTANAVTYRMEATSDGAWALDTETAEYLGGDEPILLEDGQITVYAHQVDQAGNEGDQLSSPTQFSIDTTPPGPPIIDDPGNQYDLIGEPLTEISGTSEAGAIINVTLQDDTGQIAYYQTIADLATALWTVDLTTDFLIFTSRSRPDLQSWRCHEHYRNRRR